MREMVIDRASRHQRRPAVDLEDLKIIVLMVFWSLGEEPDALILDELFVDPEIASSTEPRGPAQFSNRWDRRRAWPARCAWP